MQTSEYLNAGEISGVFGVKGWVKVFSFTEPRENILVYSPWILQRNGTQQTVEIVDGQRHGNTVVANLQGVSDRNAAEALIGSKILIQKNQLPAPEEGEYYWNDLIGLQVKNHEDIVLGHVDHLMETGANDVLVVIDDNKTERLIPFLMRRTVLNIDLANGLMLVDWDSDF